MNNLTTLINSNFAVSPLFSRLNEFLKNPQDSENKKFVTSKVQPALDMKEHNYEKDSWSRLTLKTVFSTYCHV